MSSLTIRTASIPRPKGTKVDARAPEVDGVPPTARGPRSRSRRIPRRVISPSQQLLRTTRSPDPGRRTRAGRPRCTGSQWPGYRGVRPEQQRRVRAGQPGEVADVRRRGDQDRVRLVSRRAEQGREVLAAPRTWMTVMARMLLADLTDVVTLARSSRPPPGTGPARRVPVPGAADQEASSLTFSKRRRRCWSGWRQRGSVAVSDAGLPHGLPGAPLTSPSGADQRHLLQHLVRDQRGGLVLPAGRVRCPGSARLRRVTEPAGEGRSRSSYRCAPMPPM